MNERRRSENFDFLTRLDERLVRCASTAERSFREDPDVALFKLRQFGELLASGLVVQFKLGLVGGFHDNLNLLESSRRISGRERGWFEKLRRTGNRAVHEVAGTEQEALAVLETSHRLGVWVYQRLYDPKFSPQFTRPVKVLEVNIEQELSDWRSANRASEARLPLVSFLASGARPALTISDVYVPPTLYRKVEDTPEFIPADAILSRFLGAEAGIRISVAADAGCGKTTFCRYLVGGLISAPPNTGNLPVTPFLIPAREIVEDEPAAPFSIFAAIARRAERQHSLILSEQAVRHAFQDGRPLLLIDGLDEVRNERALTTLRERVDSLCAVYTRAHVLITGRSWAIDRAGLAGFEKYELLQLSPEELTSFLHRWFRHVYAGEPGKAEQLTDDLLEGLRGQRDLLDLVTIPMFATLLALVYPDRKELPRRAGDLRELFLRQLLERWPLGREQTFAGLSPTQMRYSVEELAYLLLKEGDHFHQSVFELTEATTLIAGLIAPSGERLEAGVSERYRAEQWLEHLVERIGLLVEVGPWQYAFVHRSLAEHLALCALVRDQRRAVSFVAANYPKWDSQELCTEILLRMSGDILFQECLLEALCQSVVEAGAESDMENTDSDYLFGPRSWPDFLLQSVEKGFELGRAQLELVLDAFAQQVRRYIDGLFQEKASGIISIRDFWTERLKGLRHAPTMPPDVVERWLSARLRVADGDMLQSLVVLGSLLWGNERVCRILDTRSDRMLCSAMFVSYWPWSHVDTVKGWFRPGNEAEADRRPDVAAPLGEWSVMHVPEQEALAFAGRVRPEEVMDAALAALSLPTSARFAAAVMLSLVSKALTCGGIGTEGRETLMRSKRPWRNGLPSVLITNPGRMTVVVQTRLPPHDVSAAMPFLPPLLDLDLRKRLLSAVESRRSDHPNLPHVIRLLPESDDVIGDVLSSVPMIDAPVTQLSDDILRKLVLAGSRVATLDFFTVMAASGGHIDRDIHHGQHRRFSLEEGRSIRHLPLAPHSQATRRHKLAFVFNPLQSNMKEPLLTRIRDAALGEAIVAIAASEGLEPHDRQKHVLHRYQNRWILDCWPVVEYCLPKESDAARRALFLAFGWTQHTTTWQWPDTPNWATELRKSPVGEHWLYRAQWHLCWLTYDPMDPSNRRGLRQSLDEGRRDTELRGVAEILTDMLGVQT